jgi:cytoskeletal protein CcmA (bactofilin family)
MFGRGSKPTTTIDVLIGKGARINGDVDFAGGLHLDGRVAGSVRAESDASSMLSVSEDGQVEGSVEAAHVVLNGTVRGDIRASERLVLGPRSRVQGDVYYGIIEAALGAEIQGRLVPLSEGDTADTAEVEVAEA